VAGRVRFPRAGRHIPLPGGFGKTPGRHDDRSATLIAGLGQAETDNARSCLRMIFSETSTFPDHASAASQEARSGAELRRWFAAASAAAERRQTSALRFQRALHPPMQPLDYAFAGVPRPSIFLAFVGWASQAKPTRYGLEGKYSVGTALRAFAHPTKSLWWENESSKLARKDAARERLSFRRCRA
jgi:hypothetical protein